jgi:hypothetical protein
VKKFVVLGLVAILAAQAARRWHDASARAAVWAQATDTLP